MFQHILVAVGDDAGSRQAIKQGVALARATGARITGFHVMSELSHPGIVDELLDPPADELQVRARAHADRLFAPLFHAAEYAGVPCDTVAGQGERPWEAIVATAADLRCDLIVMASHGRRGVARWVLGSQTRQVLDHVAISVLVVR